MRGQMGYDYSWSLALEGRFFIASDADQNDRVLGQTSFANTTPTFLLHNPSTSGVLCLPIAVNLVQTGSVAGGDIFVEIESRGTSAYSSGGTAEASSSNFFAQSTADLTPAITAACTLYSNPTASNAAGRKMGHYTLAPDVSPAEGVINVLSPEIPYGLIIGPGASYGIYTYASSTGPTWDWWFEWLEIPVTSMRV